MMCLLPFGKEDFAIRNRKIIDLYKKGIPYNEIGKIYNLSSSRVKQIIYYWRYYSND